jgi:hypothetical protein
MSAHPVPAGPVRDHVRALLDEGMTQAALCRAARVTSSYISALLYGQYSPGRPPQQTTDAPLAARLLAVRYDGPEPKAPPAMCVPGGRYTPVGYRTGRCADCAQLAPIHTVGGQVVMFSHPRPECGADTRDAPKAIRYAHPDCGTTKGAQRHRREKTELCEPCRFVIRGYDAGYKAGLTKAGRDGRVAVPPRLGTAVVAACRAIAYRRPVPRIRELAVEVVRIADAELYDDDTVTELAA